MRYLSDSDLISLISDDNRQAFNQLFERHWSRLFSIAVARIQDEQEAQDIIQEIFIKLWERRSRLVIHGEVEHYLYGAVKLSVIQHFRSKKVNERQMENALQRMNILEDSINAIEDYLELEKTLENALSLMPQTLRDIYQMRTENISVKHIADRLGLADQTVKNYIGEITRRLRAAVLEQHPEKHMTYVALLALLLHK